MLKTYNNIIFDLGNVLIDLAPERTHQTLKELGADDFKKVFNMHQGQHPIINQYETNAITDDEFRQHLQHILKFTANHNEIDDALCAMLLPVPDESWQLLKQLSKKYRVFILSNTNRIHMTHQSKLLMNQYQVDSFDAVCEKTYFSFELGKRKPDADIFEHVLNDKDLIASETLFLDNNEDNIKMAQQLGLQTIHVLKRNDVASYF